MIDQILAALVGSLPGSESAKSSHWKKHTTGFDPKAKNHSIDGFGVRQSRSLPVRIWNALMQRYLFLGSDIFKTAQYRTMEELCRRQRRALSLDSLRHVFTHRLLASRPSPIHCVVGDGMSHYVGPKLLEGGVKIVSVNLPEVLFSDANILAKADLIDDFSARVATTRSEVTTALADPSVRLILVPAQHAETLRDQGIGLFVNIASFQEMTPTIIANYFDLIRSNAPTTFYCCNRERKELYGGERLVFADYPWGDVRELALDEDCPWHQQFYASRPPLIRRYDGNIRHRIVVY